MDCDKLFVTHDHKTFVLLLLFSRGVRPCNWPITTVADVPGRKWVQNDIVREEDMCVVGTNFNFAPLGMKLPSLSLCPKFRPNVSIFHIEEGTAVGVSHGSAIENPALVAAHGLRQTSPLVADPLAVQCSPLTTRLRGFTSAPMQV